MLIYKSYLKRSLGTVVHWAVAAALCGTGVSSAQSSHLRISASPNVSASSEQEADYTATHVFLDEVKRQSLPLTIHFESTASGIASVEVFTNLNRRERATQDADGDGVEDGIKSPDGNKIPAGNDENYYRAYPMTRAAHGYLLTLTITQCGVFRLTARYRLRGDGPGIYHWYNQEQNDHGVSKRDHSIVVSPEKVRRMQMYEADVMNVDAQAATFAGRSVFADLGQGLSTSAVPRFSLDYLKSLGVNALWMLPIHPAGVEGREIDDATGQPFNAGSPYSVKNFFEVNPLLGRSAGDSVGSPSEMSARAEAMSEFQGFVAAADKRGIDIVLDAPFNHSSHDAELGLPGQTYWGGATSSSTTEIRQVEPRFYSRKDHYDARALTAADIAIAPDRYDFPKWTDVYDIYFGRYAALVSTNAQKNEYLDEGDWFDSSVGSDGATGQGNGHFDATTQHVWQYFGDYLQFWLTTTGYPTNATGTAIDSDAGIDGLRGDFAQGLPPQLWEYLVNRTRTRKWNFLFLAESLDGGPVSFRSSRHFDVLNENLIYALHDARTASDFQKIYDDRRNLYGATMVLLNTSSHDEDNYADPFQGILRFATNSTIDGVSMISAGQELGLRGAVGETPAPAPAAGPYGVAVADTTTASSQPYGYDIYFSPFFGKSIPQFMTFNSLMPLWRDFAQQKPETMAIHSLYASIGGARSSSAALRSADRDYLVTKSRQPQPFIFAVAKMEQRNADPGSSDVVFAFVSLKPRAVEDTGQDTFDLNVDADHDGRNDFGIQPTHRYNVKNLAAYTGSDARRNLAWLWQQNKTGADLLRDGLAVHLNAVPADNTAWKSAPWEPLYLKLFDVTNVP